MSNMFAKTFALSTIFSSLDYCSNSFSAITNLLQSNQKTLVPAQFTLEKSEVFRIPSAYQELHVLSGVAWLTVAGEDITLTAGETATIASGHGVALISALGDAPLILEVIWLISSNSILLS